MAELHGTVGERWEIRGGTCWECFLGEEGFGLNCNERGGAY